MPYFDSELVDRPFDFYRSWLTCCANCLREEFFDSDWYKRWSHGDEKCPQCGVNRLRANPRSACCPPADASRVAVATVCRSITVLAYIVRRPCAGLISLNHGLSHFGRSPWCAVSARRGADTLSRSESETWDASDERSEACFASSGEVLRPDARLKWTSPRFSGCSAGCERGRLYCSFRESGGY